MADYPAKQIYMGDAVAKLNEKCARGEFSRRVNEIVERYGILLRLTKVPTLTEIETQIMGEVLSGTVVNTTLVSGLPYSIEDASTGTDKEREELAEKVRAMTPADRLVLIEKVLS